MISLKQNLNPCSYHMYPNMIPYFHISKWQNICAMPRKNKTRTKYFRSLTLSHSTLNLFISKTTKLHTFLNWLPHAILSIDVFSCSGFYEDLKKVKFHVSFLFTRCAKIQDVPKIYTFNRVTY